MQGRYQDDLPHDSQHCKPDSESTFQANHFPLHNPTQADDQDSLEVTHNRAAHGACMCDDIKLRDVDECGTEAALNVLLVKGFKGR